MKLQALVASRLFSSGNIGLVLAAACLGGFVSPAHALIVKNAGNQNYRFMDNALGPINSAPVNPIFIGSQYDWSGVAIKAADGAGNYHPAGAMMISPHYYVTASHYASQASLSFRSRDGRTITKNVAGGKPMTTTLWNGTLATADLYIGKLEGVGITVADMVSTYPVVVQPVNNWQWYLGKNIVVYSMNGGNAVGLNTVSNVLDASVLSYTSKSIWFNYDGRPNGNGYDNMAGVNGESGSPWLLVYNGQLTAGGAHSGYYGTASATSYYTSMSSFVPYYVDQINAYIHESYPNENVTVQGIPEPTGLALALGAGALLMRRKRS